MQPVPEHIDELIARFLAGEASEGQIKHLNDWKKEHELNQSYFTQCELLYHSAEPTIEHVFDTDRAWAQLQRKIKENQTKSISPVVKTELPLFLRIAAVLLIVAGISWWIAGNHATKETLTLTTTNQILQDTLPDGSTLTLNRNSSLNYSADFGKSERRLTLKGEAYFTVQHHAKTPFIVVANGILIEDIGTSFNVKATGDSSYVEVIVEEGEVHFYLEGTEGILLTKGQGGIYRKTDGVITRFEVHNPMLTAYHSGVLDFNDTPISDVVIAVGRMYGVSIEAEKEIENCRLTVQFNKEELETVVNVICETLGFTIDKNEKRILLKGSGCKN